MPNFDEIIQQNHDAIDEFTKGNNKPLERLYSQRDDVTLGNPFGPFVRGFEEVAKTMQRAASFYREGEATGFDLVANRNEDGAWKLVHRHADPITSAQSAESVIQR